eukprot:SAG25_NODE_4712_length_764_cov_0.783459_1_plen_90_part_00
MLLLLLVLLVLWTCITYEYNTILIRALNLLVRVTLATGAERIQGTIMGSYSCTVRVQLYRTSTSTRTVTGTTVLVLVIDLSTAVDLVDS